MNDTLFLGGSTTDQSNGFTEQEDDTLLCEYFGCIDEQDASQ